MRYRFWSRIKPNAPLLGAFFCVTIIRSVAKALLNLRGTLEMIQWKDISTKTVVAGVEFPSYIMNACGVRDTTLEELQTIGTSASAGIVMKSCTILPKEGNPLPRMAHLERGILQSMGLPNLGYKEYLKFIPELKKYGKPIIASVAGKDPKEFKRLVEPFMETDVDIIGLNPSCPNLDGRMICYDIREFQIMLLGLSDLIKISKKPIKIKLPPYNDPWQQKFVSEILVQYSIRCITLVNGVGRCLVIDTETEAPVIKATHGYGALAGEMIKYQALGNVRAFYDHLQGKNISIIGVGGIRTGEDAFQFLLAGADAVQVGSTFEKQGPKCFARIDRELRKIMAEHGYPTIESAKGKMKQYGE